MKIFDLDLFLYALIAGIAFSLSSCGEKTNAHRLPAWPLHPTCLDAAVQVQDTLRRARVVRGELNAMEISIQKAKDAWTSLWYRHRDAHPHYAYDLQETLDELMVRLAVLEESAENAAYDNSCPLGRRW